MPIFEPVDHDPWADDAPAAPNTLRFTVRPRRDDDGQGIPGVADPGADPSAVAPAQSPADAAQAAREAAAYRTRQSVDPIEGRQEGAFTDTLMDTLLPGRQSLRDVSEGNYGAAAAHGAMAVLPFSGMARRVLTGGAGIAGATGAILAPSNNAAEAADNPFAGVVTDPGELKLLMAQYNKPIMRTNARGVRVVDKDATDEMQRNLQASTRKEYAARAAAESKRKTDLQTAEDSRTLAAGQASDRFKAWQDSNAETLAGYKKNNPARLAEYNAARGLSTDDTILAQRNVLKGHALEDQAAAKAQELENKPFLERNPTAAMVLEGAALGLGGIGPATSMLSRAGALKGLVRDSEHAIRTGAPEAERMILQNKLAAAQKLPAVNKKELLSMLAAPPLMNTVIPGVYDGVTKGFGSKAFNADWDESMPWTNGGWNEKGLKRTGFNLLEGFGAPAVSYGLASGVLGPMFGRDFEALHGQAGAASKSLDQYQALQAAGGSPHQAALAAAQGEAAHHAGVAAQLQQQLDEIAANRAAAAAKGQKTRLKNQKAAEAEAKTAAKEPPRETELLPRANALRANALNRGKRKPKGALVAPGSSTGALQIPDL